MNTNRVILSLIFLALLAVVGYFAYQNYLAPAPQEMNPAPTQAAAEASNAISAEGKVTPARSTPLSFTQAGRVVEVLVKEGDQVQAGDTLARLDTRTLEAAHSQAQAALETAQAGLQLALTRAEATRLAARRAEAPVRQGSWEKDVPVEFDQPAWYFEKPRQTAAAQKEAENARSALEIEQANLKAVLERASSADLLDAEGRLADAQAAFLVAKDVLDRATDSNDTHLRDQAQSNFDSAKSELDAAQAAYDQALDTQGAADVLEARARLAVAQERYDAAMDRLDSLQTGEQSLEVRLADEAMKQAETAVEEAKAAVETARVAIEEAVIRAPASGLIAQLDLESGEAASPGRQVILLADFSAWQVETTDLSETDVALLKAGMPAKITLDAFPGRTFSGRISQIALVSEDTRGSVTYTITLEFDPGDAPVRWGMTAFVEIERL